MMCKYHFLFFFFSSFFFFYSCNLQHIEVTWLGAELELQLPAYTTATGMHDRSHICDLCVSWGSNPHPPRDDVRYLIC